MIRLALRLQRIELGIVAVVVAAIGVMLLSTHSYVVQMASNPTPETCPIRLSPGERACLLPIPSVYRLLESGHTLLMLLPIFVGSIVALPLVADLDRGTYRFAWTQSHSRRSWLMRQFTVSLTALAVAMTVLLALFRWWQAPILANGGSRFVWWFELTGIVIYAWAILAFGLVTVVGVLSRRVVVALVLGSVLAVAIFSPWINLARDHLVAPVTRDDSVPSSDGDLPLTSYIVDGSGDRLTYDGFWTLCAPNGDPEQLTRQLQEACVAEHGLVFMTEVRLASHYWPMQIREFAIIGLIGIVSTGIGAWWVLKRWE